MGAFKWIKTIRKDAAKRGAVNFCTTLFGMLIICNCVFVFHYIPSGSMEPTIKTNSFAVCWRLPYLIGNPSPHYGDVVSFYSEEKEKILIKRVIGLPGDTISFYDGHVIRNGEYINEEYLEDNESSFPYQVEDYKIPEDHFYVLGDNRQYSVDSRMFNNPYIPIKMVYAKMLWSFPLP